MSSDDVEQIGDLEFAVLEFLWEEEAATVKSIHAAVGERRDIRHNTTQSATKRLWEKGLLDRTKEGHAYRYRPQVDREELTERRIASVVDAIAGGEMDVAMQAFVRLADRTGDETLEQLQELVDRHRRGDEGDES